MDLKDAGTSKNTQVRRSKTQILDIKCCGADRARVGPILACQEQKGSNLLIQRKTKTLFYLCLQLVISNVRHAKESK